jgi:hypothetical protein
MEEKKSALDVDLTTTFAELRRNEFKHWDRKRSPCRSTSQHPVPINVRAY